MADKREGFLPIWHGVWKTELFERKDRFDVRSAWFWLIMHAYYKPKKIVINGEVIEAKRGQYFTSYRYLASVFHWDVGTVRRYLNGTQKLGMTAIFTTRNGTLITILNYSKYNSSKDHDENDAYTDAHMDAYTDAHTDAHTDATLVNKEYKENKRIKKEKEASGRRCRGWGDVQK